MKGEERERGRRVCGREERERGEGAKRERKRERMSREVQGATGR